MKKLAVACGAVLLSCSLLAAIPVSWAATEPSASDPATDTVEVASGITGEHMAEGVYQIDATIAGVESLVVDNARLSVTSDGEMTAVLTLSDQDIDMVYQGSAEDASVSNGSGVIRAVEDDGVNTFTITVEALDVISELATYSDSSRAWTDGAIVFDSSSLPSGSVLSSARFDTATQESCDLKDGTYTMDVALTGGSGKASVESPATVVVKDGLGTATVVWSSSNYDYMLVNGAEYEPTTTTPASTFEIPVMSWDEAFDVVADTTAMSTNHEIDYTLAFDTASAQRVGGGLSLGAITGIVIAIIVVIALIVVLVRRKGKKVPPAADATKTQGQGVDVQTHAEVAEAGGQAEAPEAQARTEAERDAVPAANVPVEDVPKEADAEDSAEAEEGVAVEAEPEVAAVAAEAVAAVVHEPEHGEATEDVAAEAEPMPEDVAERPEAEAVGGEGPVVAQSEPELEAQAEYRPESKSHA